MSDAFLDPGGVVAPASSLQLPRAKALAEAVASGRLAYVQPVEYRQRAFRPGVIAEAIVFQVEVERPQHCQNDIRRYERIAVTFAPADDCYPEVLALRSDFPVVPHLNLRSQELPRSLCLYDQPWSQIALRWTSAGFIERIRFWLAETAKGTLHEADQPLEPLIMGAAYKIILPAEVIDGLKDGETKEFRVQFTSPMENCRVLRAETGKGEKGLPFVALSLVAQSQIHGIIRHAPGNLHELDSFLAAGGIALLDTLRNKLQDWTHHDLNSKHVLLLIAFPLSRDGHEEFEVTDIWAFLTTRNVVEVGVDIGLLEKTQHGFGRVMQTDPDCNGRSIELEIMSPVFDMTRESAAAASDMRPDTRRAIAVGVGALGSQLLRILAQQGFGKWCLIDEDVLLPHNAARHSLDRSAIGYPKAFAVGAQIHSLLREPEQPVWIQCDILDQGANAAKIAEQFQAADLLLDLAASIPVSRYLAHEANSPARRIAAFLNPRGTDLVLLVEDAKRAFRLDGLEMQYYRAIAFDDRLNDHLLPPDGRIRYARSCRDVTTTLPTHRVAMHAALGAEAVRQATDSPSASIQVWRSDPQTLEIRRVDIPVAAMHRNQIGDWTLAVDDHLMRRISGLRAVKLPNETGGVLIGAYDLIRKIVYVVETIPSPPDSEEWPTLYIRGSKGLSARVQEIQSATDAQLEYVGEWHSHPDRCECRPSEDDMKVFGWLTANLSDAGLPALMAIAGEGGVSAWFLGEMLRTGGWEVDL